MSHPHEGAPAQPDFLTPGDMTMLVGSAQLAGHSLQTLFATADSGRRDEAMTAYDAFLAGQRLYTGLVRKKWGIDDRDKDWNDRTLCEDPSDSFHTVGARYHVAEQTESGNYWRNVCAWSLLRPLGYGWDPDNNLRYTPSKQHPVVSEMFTGKTFWQAVGAPPGQQLLRVLPGYRMFNFGPSPYAYPVTVDANSVVDDIGEPIVRLVQPDTGEPYFIARGGDHKGIENTIFGTNLVYHGSVDIPTTTVPVGGRVFDRDGTITGWQEEQPLVDACLRKVAADTPILLWTRNLGNTEQGYKGTSREFAKRGVVFPAGFDYDNWPLRHYLSFARKGEPLVDERRVGLIRSQLGTLFPVERDLLYAESALDQVVRHLHGCVNDSKTALETKPPVIAAMIAELPLSPEERVGMLRTGVVYNDSLSAARAAPGSGANTVMVTDAQSLVRGVDFRPRVRTDR